MAGEKPAARITDLHLCSKSTGPVPHVGGPVLIGSPNVFIGGLPAARVADVLTCVGPPDVIVQGSPIVFINGRPAARMGDLTAHGGVIVGGCPTVLIGASGDPTDPGGSSGMGRSDDTYSPSKAGYHHYRAGPDVVCSARQRCTKAEMADQLSRFAVPGQNPAIPVKSSQISTVYAPGTDIPVGTVTTSISKDGLTVVNQTNTSGIKP